MTPNPAVPDPPAHADGDVLIDLAAGLLEPATARRWWEHLKTCSDCEDRMRITVADLERGRSRVPDALRGGALRAVAPRAGRRNPVREYGLVAIGAMAAVVAIALVFARPGAGPLTPGWLPPVGNAIELRAPGTGDEGPVREGLRAYESRDLPRAIRLLSSAPPGTDALDQLGQLYLAGALAAEGRAQEALDVLDRLDVERFPHPWRGEALWLRAASLERLGRRDESRAVLERLSGEPGDEGRRARAALAGTRR